MNKKTSQKRYNYSPAYIDSGIVTAYFTGVIAFAVWIAWQTADVISPVWIALSIVAISSYQMGIFWLLRQYWEIDRIFSIYINNITCLGLYFLAAEYITDVKLPVELPIINLTLYLMGVEATSLSPGAVALSYSLVAIICGAIVAVVIGMFEDSGWMKKVKHTIGLERIDFMIDKVLDKLSFWMDRTSYEWLSIPLVMLVGVLVVVIGLAAYFY